MWESALFFTCFPMVIHNKYEIQNHFTGDIIYESNRKLSKENLKLVLIYPLKQLISKVLLQILWVKRIWIWNFKNVPQNFRRGLKILYPQATNFQLNLKFMNFFNFWKKKFLKYFLTHLFYLSWSWKNFWAEFREDQRTYSINSNPNPLFD
jgi:hypothetical protein